MSKPKYTFAVDWSSVAAPDGEPDDVAPVAELRPSDHNRYALARAAARRARHLYAGATPLGISKSKNPVRIALDELQGTRLIYACAER